MILVQPFEILLVFGAECHSTCFPFFGFGSVLRVWLIFCSWFACLSVCSIQLWCWANWVTDLYTDAWKYCGFYGKCFWRIDEVCTLIIGAFPPIAILPFCWLQKSSCLIKFNQLEMILFCIAHLNYYRDGTLAISYSIHRLVLAYIICNCRGAVGQPRLLVPVALVMIYNRWNE